MSTSEKILQKDPHVHFSIPTIEQITGKMEIEREQLTKYRHEEEDSRENTLLQNNWVEVKERTGQKNCLKINTVDTNGALSKE